MKISIFIPTYNSGELLRETLDSVLAQTHRDIEVLCVDDSSTDNTWDILNEYASRDDRVKVFRKPNEGSVPFSWNYVFPHLTGEFTLYMSHDDLLKPDTIERLAATAESDPEIDCIMALMVEFEQDLDKPEETYAYINQKSLQWSKSTPISGKEAFVASLDYDLLNAFGLWRTEMIRRAGMPTETFNSDDLMHRLWRLECRKVAFSDAIFGYRQTPNSILKGYKLYHYKGLRVHNRLAGMIDGFGEIDKARRDEITYNWYKWLRIHNSYFSRNKTRYTKAEQKEIAAILRERWATLAPRVGDVTAGGLSGLLIRLSLRNFAIFRLMGKIDKI